MCRGCCYWPQQAVSGDTFPLWVPGADSALGCRASLPISAAGRKRPPSFEISLGESQGWLVRGGRLPVLLTHFPKTVASLSIRFPSSSGLEPLPRQEAESSRLSAQPDAPLSILPGGSGGGWVARLSGPASVSADAGQAPCCGDPGLAEGLPRALCACLGLHWWTGQEGFLCPGDAAGAFLPLQEEHLLQPRDSPRELSTGPQAQREDESSAHRPGVRDGASGQLPLGSKADRGGLCCGRRGRGLPPSPLPQQPARQNQFADSLLPAPHAVADGIFASPPPKTEADDRAGSRLWQSGGRRATGSALPRPAPAQTLLLSPSCG